MNMKLFGLKLLTILSIETKFSMWCHLQAYKRLFGNIYEFCKIVWQENIGLYRDVGLAIINNKSARLADKTRKELHIV